MSLRDTAAIKVRLGTLRADLIAVQDDPHLSVAQRRSALDAIFDEIIDLHVRWGEALTATKEPH